MIDGMKQNITLKIGGLEYALSINPELEEGMRAAAARINEEMDYLVDHYGNVSQSEVLTIMLLRTEVRLLELKRRNAGEAGDLTREIEALNTQLEEYLLGR